MVQHSKGSPLRLEETAVYPSSHLYAFCHRAIPGGRPRSCNFALALTPVAVYNKIHCKRDGGKDNVGNCMSHRNARVGRVGVERGALERHGQVAEKHSNGECELRRTKNRPLPPALPLPPCLPHSLDETHLTFFLAPLPPQATPAPAPYTCSLRLPYHPSAVPPRQPPARALRPPPPPRRRYRPRPPRLLPLPPVASASTRKQLVTPHAMEAARARACRAWHGGEGAGGRVVGMS